MWFRVSELTRLKPVGERMWGNIVSFFFRIFFGFQIISRSDGWRIKGPLGHVIGKNLGAEKRDLM